MDEKPTFWQFYRARWRQRYSSEFIYTIGKERRVSGIYYKPDFYDRLCFLIDILFCLPLTLIIIMQFDFWKNLDSDIFIVSYAALFLLDILLWRIIFSFMDFKKLPEDEWEATDYKKINKYRKLKKGIIISLTTIITLFMLLNSYSFAYLRYIAEGGQGGRIGIAEAIVYVPDNTIVRPSQETVTDGTFNVKKNSDEKEIDIKIKTAKLPEKVYIYLNGKDITDNKPDYKTWYFWEGGYFNKTFNYDTKLKKLDGLNTLEVKSENFDKVWTFTLD